MLKVRVGLSCVPLAFFMAAGILTSTNVKAQAVRSGAVTSVPVSRGPAASNTIVWNGFVELNNAGHKKGLNFEGASFTPEGLPELTLIFKNQALENLQLTNTTYEPLTTAEAAVVPASYKSAQPQIASGIGLEEGQPNTVVTIIPLRVNAVTGQKEKLVSFSYTSQPARNVPKARTTNNYTFGTSSVLNSSNDFYRVGITDNGIYKIDRQFLASLGLNPDQVNPNNLQVYGNGGGMLPQANAAERHNDLVENAIAVQHNGNNSFEEGEYALFYGQSPHAWRLNGDSTRFSHVLNLYSDTTYYFITVGNTPGKRVTTKASLPGNGIDITTSDERAFHEQELENFMKSGRNWYGEKFTSFSLVKDVSFPVTAMKPGTTAHVTIDVLNTARSAATFNIAANGSQLGNIGVGAVNTTDNNPYGNVGIKAENTFSRAFPAPPSEVTLKITYSVGGGAAPNGYLNFIELNYQRQLRLTDNQLAFRKRLETAPGTLATFRLSNATPNTVIWDITNPLRPVSQLGNNNQGDFTFTTDSIAKREFIAFDGSSFAQPVAAGKVGQQNLHALNLNGELDLIIVVHPKFRAAAEQLAQHRRNNDGLKVALVTPQQIYNEFSSGAQDITAIRDMMRMVYLRKPQNKRMFLLLFGDASYDYRHNRPNNTNYVPIYEAPDAGTVLHNTQTYSSDDYYGFMDENEGAWNNNVHFLDIGVGRIPVNTPEAAQIVVTKLINYNSPATFGKWRNTVTVVGDDGDSGFHLSSAEKVVNKIEAYNSNVNIKKLYLDAYPQISVASGQRSPEVNTQLDRIVEQGTLILNFSGHGSETGWMHERVLDIPQIQSWTNADKLAFFVTATCEFGRYDDPDRNSGGEYVLISEKGGGIGLLTTTRPVYVHSNDMLNGAFADAVFLPINGEMPRLGDVLRITKNNSINNLNNRNFALLGDPSARLAYPEHIVRVTKVNNQAVSAVADTLRALSHVTIEGNITDAAGNTLTSFNQQLQATVYEKPSTIPTLGDHGNTPTTFKVRQNVIYDGLATVSNGTFKFEFVVPKDINYNFGLGKISLYSNTFNTDATGNHSNVVIGGTDPNAANDTDAPQAELFMNDESFVFGGATGTEATFLAKLYDENGINTAGIGIGHELKATLDEKDEFILNEYYTADVNSFKSGTIRYPLKGLENGPHSIRLKVWDTHNNSHDEYIEFIVVNDADLALSHVLNYPNPFSQQTTFHFDHNRAGDPLEIQVQVFTVSGKLVKTINQQASDFSRQSHVKTLSWDGRDEFNDKLAKGVYVYKVSVRSLRDGSKAHEYQKLVILN